MVDKVVCLVLDLRCPSQKWNKKATAKISAVYNVKLTTIHSNREQTVLIDGLLLNLF